MKPASPDLSGIARRLGDWAIFALVEAAVILRHPVLWALLQYRDWRQGAWWSFVAVPRHANEKFLWRKIFDRDPRFNILSDKIACKEWLATLDLPVPMPRTLWSGTDPAAIPDALLGGDVFVKAAHGWKMNIRIRRGKPARAEWEPKARAFMAARHGQGNHEWGYFDVPHRLIVEEGLGSGAPVVDLKVYTIGRHVERFCPIYRDDPVTGSLWESVCDSTDPRDFVKLTQQPIAVSAIDDHPPPPGTALALQAAARIGACFDHVRVDFMIADGVLYLGELTLYNAGGMSFTHRKLDADTMTRRWDLRRTWFLNAPHRGWPARYAAALRRAVERQARREPLLGTVEPLPAAVLAQMRSGEKGQGGAT